MSSKLERFIKSTPLKKSLFFEYQDDIFKLKELGFPSSKICEYLQSIGVKTSTRNLNKWLERQHKNSKSTTLKVVDSVQATPATKQKSPSMQAQSEEVNDDAVAKFMKFATKKHSVDELINIGKKNS